MTLPIYTVNERHDLAKKLRISEQSLYQYLTRRKIPSALTARRLNKADPRFKLQDLRPNDWADLWPDLKKRKVA